MASPFFLRTRDGEAWSGVPGPAVFQTRLALRHSVVQVSTIARPANSKTPGLENRETRGTRLLRFVALNREATNTAQSENERQYRGSGRYTCQLTTTR